VLKIGSTFRAQVKDLSSDGRAVITHPEGRIFFAPGTWLGETGEFRITGLKGRIGFAELVILENVSPHRVQAPCPHHGFSRQDCGACPWQFIAYSEQLRAKQDRVEQAVSRLPCSTDVLPIEPSPNQFAYRNRAQLKTDGERLGYVAAQSNDLVAISSCRILTTHNQHTLQQLLAALPQSRWKTKRKQRWTTLDIDETVDAGSVSVNQRLPFRQANTAQNNFIRAWLSAQLADLSAKNAVELFSGSGNLSEVLIDASIERLLAVEVVEEALRVLAQKELPGVECLQCDLFDGSAVEKLAMRLKNTELLLLDPPRDGLKIREPLLKRARKLKTILYISCDLASFCRDVKDFLEHGFQLTRVQPVDMFPHTPHIELLARLRR